MRAAVLQGGRFVVREVPDPSPGPGQLLLRVAACGICGSDLKAAPRLPDGTVMGHEFAGELVALGPDVAGEWRIGAPVVSMPVIGCGTCADCVLGDVARCPQGQHLGVGGGAGAFAEYVVVGARESVVLGDAVPLAPGALVEPLAVGLHAVVRARIGAGDRVLVIGAGPVGLATLLWASRLGVGELVVSDPLASRREAAGGYGATAVVDPTTEELGGPFDVVIECVGARGMVATALDVVAPRGRVVIAGVCVEEDAFVPVVGVVKEVDMAFVSYYTRQEFTLVATLLGSGRLDAGALVTGRVGLAELDETVAELSSASGQRKVLVVP